MVKPSKRGGTVIQIREWLRMKWNSGTTSTIHTLSYSNPNRSFEQHAFGICITTLLEPLSPLSLVESDHHIYQEVEMEEKKNPGRNQGEGNGTARTKQ